jgi:uncharacterized protein
MNCPKCSTLLNEVTKAGVLIDVCDRCLGVWLERGELEKITARLRQLEQNMNGDVRRPPASPRGVMTTTTTAVRRAAAAGPTCSTSSTEERQHAQR